MATKLSEWAVREKLDSVRIDLGKQRQDQVNESFNCKFRGEWLSIDRF